MEEHYLKWEDPLYVYDENGNYTKEIDKIYGRRIKNGVRKIIFSTNSYRKLKRYNIKSFRSIRKV